MCYPPRVPHVTVRNVGRLVPHDGYLVGRHDGVLNFLATDRDGPFLVSLIRDPANWTELAVQIDAVDWPRVAGVPDRTPLETVLPRTAGQDPAPRYSPTDLYLPSRDALLACRTALLARHGTTGVVPLLRSTASGEAPDNSPMVDRARRLLSAARDRGEPAVSAATGLVGLGPGMTPSGDDFLSGVLLAALLGAVPAPSPSHRRVMRRRLSATTAGGSSLLRLALAGYPPAYQVRTIAALSAPEAPIVTALGIAAEHGHSSGLDFLSGFLWASVGQV